MSNNVMEFAGLRQQILANYRVIDPENSDADLITILRKKTAEELMNVPAITYGTEYMCGAVLISAPDKGKKILMSEFTPWSTHLYAMIKLHQQTCKILGDKMLESSK